MKGFQRNVSALGWCDLVPLRIGGYAVVGDQRGLLGQFGSGREERQHRPRRRLRRFVGAAGRFHSDDSERYRGSLILDVEAHT